MRRIFSWSSSNYCISSTPFSTYVPVFLYFMSSSRSNFTLSSISFSFFSIVCCFSALFETSSIISLYFPNPASSNDFKLISSFGVISVIFAALKISFQCPIDFFKVVIASVDSNSIIHMFSLKLSMCFFNSRVTFAATSSSKSKNVLLSLMHSL